MKVKQLKARRLAAMGAVAAVAAASVLVAPSAVAAPACTGGQSYRGDVDGDDVPDTVVGIPNHSSSKGAVDLHLADGTSKLIDSSAAGVAPRAGDQFGRSVAVGDIDFDGCDDLVIGAPGAPGGGYVAVILGGPSGVVTAGRFTIPNPGASGDGFGTALGLAKGYGDPSKALWVGAPGATVTAKGDSGAAYQYRLATAGDATTATQLGKVTTNSIGLGAGAQAGERLGEVLSVETDGNRVVLGVPRRDVDEQADAGAIVVVSPAFVASSVTNPTYDSNLITQDSDDVDDRPEAGDRFGASVAGGWDGIAVGIPGEDVWKVKKKALRGLSKKAKKKAVKKARKAGTDVGAVQLFRYGSPAELITKNSKFNDRKIPGDSRRGDRFGASVAYGEGLTCAGAASIAIGVPGEDVVVKPAKKATKKKKARKAKVAKNAGGVIVLTESASAKKCRPVLVAQGGTLTGKAEKGDGAGSTIAIVFDRDTRGDRSDQLLVGAPGEDVGAATDAGVVNGHADVNRTGGPVANLAYGSVFTSVMQG